MKLIRCSNCGARSIGPGTERFPSGAPVVMGQWIGTTDHPIVYKCHRCQKAMKLTSAEFNRLPVLGEGELEDLGFTSQRAVP